MARKKLKEFGTNLEGLRFSDAMIDKVWKNEEIIPGKDPDLYHRDVTGKVICKPSYDMNSRMGWEIDYKKPLAKEGTDNLRNLQPLQTGQNRNKGGQYPWEP